MFAAPDRSEDVRTSLRVSEYLPPWLNPKWISRPQTLHVHHNLQHHYGERASFIYIYIYIPLSFILKTAVGVKLASLEGFGFLVWTRRSRRAERDIERNVVKAKHRNTLLLPRIQWGELTINLPGCRSPPRGSFRSFFFIFSCCYFLAGPLSQLFCLFVFLSNFTFPSVSVLCQVGSRCHRNHQRLRPLSVSLSQPLHLSAFLSFLWCDKYLFPRHSEEEGGREAWRGEPEWFLRS